MKSSPLYRASKWLFLLLNTALLPAATYYIMSNISVYDWGLIILIGTYALIPYWLVYFLGMGMYRFPTHSAGGISITAALLAPLFIYWHLVPGGIFFAAYLVFLSTFFGTTLFLLTGLLSTMFGSPGKTKHHSTLPLTILLLGFTAFFSYGLSKPLIVFIESLSKNIILAISAFVAATLVIAFTNYQMTQETTDALRKKEWQKWTNPVAGAILISLFSTIGILFSL